MNIITLNIWGGRVSEKLIPFMETVSKTVDIICLQEVYSGFNEDLESLGNSDSKNFNVFENIKNATSKTHVALFMPVLAGYYGEALLVSKQYEILESGQYYIYQHEGFIPHDNLGRHACAISWCRVEDTQGKQMIIGTMHGLWNGQGKGDTDERIEQSNRIVSFLNTQTLPWVLCGDCNINPDTQSYKMIREVSDSELIIDNGILSTRTELYKHKEVSPHATYIFTKGCKTQRCEVLPDVVSDHAGVMFNVLT